MFETWCNFSATKIASSCRDKNRLCKRALTKAFPLKLFLDIVPSSSEDVTHAMRGQPKRFSRNYLRRIGGNVILYVFVSFPTRVVFCIFSSLSIWPGFRLFFWLFGCSIFCRLFGFREFNSANFNGNGSGNEYNGCVSVRYNSLFISLPLFTKVHKTTTWNSHILNIWKKANYRRLILKIPFSNFKAVLHILFGIFLTVKRSCGTKSSMLEGKLIIIPALGR